MPRPIGKTGVAAFGATSSLPDALAKVPWQSDLPTFVIVRCARRFVEFTTSALAKPLEGQLDGSEPHEAGHGLGKVLEVLSET